jgi:hypothetical protein
MLPPMRPVAAERNRNGRGGRRSAAAALVLGCAGLVGLLLPVSVAGTAWAQVLPADVELSLLRLEMEGCRVRYSPGSLDRAAHVQEWLCELADGAARLGAPRELEALVIAREEWERGRVGCRFGLPCALAGGALALPAAGDPTTVALWRSALDELPAMGGAPLLGTADEAASLAPADALAIAWVARRQVQAAGFAAEEAWVLDLLGHLLFIDSTRKLQRGPGIAAFWARVRRRAAEADPPAGELAAEMVRQARLFAAAEAIAGSSRRMPARHLRRLQNRGGGMLRAGDLREEWPQAFPEMPSGAP